jgi:hypothetical protein
MVIGSSGMQEAEAKSSNGEQSETSPSPAITTPTKNATPLSGDHQRADGISDTLKAARLLSNGELMEMSPRPVHLKA